MNEMATINMKNVLTATDKTFGNENLDNATERIKNNIAIANRTIFDTAMILNDIKNNSATYFNNTDFTSLEEYGSKIFGFKKAYIYKLCQITRFITKTDNGYSILTDCDGFEFNVSQLVELLPLDDKMIQDNIKLLDSNTSCKDLRDIVKKIKNPALETTASETNSKNDKNSDKKTEEMTDVEICNKILEYVANIHNEDIKAKLINFMEKCIKSCK